LNIFFFHNKKNKLTFFNMPIFLFLAYQIFKLYSYCIIIYVLINILISFNIINTNNKFIDVVLDFLYRIVEPALKYIRKFIPIFGSIDISPVILLILVNTVLYAIERYGF
tara:strand:- start:488 stop:817 length:330 start_codon:yes stop_codon:yes gene_type:complete